MPPRPTPRSTGAEPSFSSGSRGRTHHPRRPPVIGPRPRGPVRSNPGMVVSPHFVLICVKIYKCIEWCCSALQPEVIRPVAVPPGLITSLWKDGRWKDVPGDRRRQGRGRPRERPGGGGGRRIPFNQRHRDGGCSIPLPGEPPPPRGRFSIDTVPGDLAVSSRSHLRFLKDPLSAPWHGYPVLSSHTARPLWRGREEAAERPGGGG
jgi:hypothetical protein